MACSEPSYLAVNLDKHHTRPGPCEGRVGSLTMRRWVYDCMRHGRSGS